MSFKSLYAAFDLYPSAKGAATHIHQMVRALLQNYGGTYLYVLGNERLPIYQDEGDLKIIRFNSSIENYLERAETFGESLSAFVSQHNELELIHFRDIWSGLAVLGSHRLYKTVFEVNALMSVELPYRYPFLSKKLLSKIESIEKFCMDKADSVFCPSYSIKENLCKKGPWRDKITVITNGAELRPEYATVDDIPQNYILYFGALQYWQGVDDLIKAFAGLKDYKDLKLVICSSNSPSYAKPYKKLAEKLEVSSNIIWNYQLPKYVLNGWIKNAKVSVAPMKETERNIYQGFSPLKIFESMSLAVPVIATDLPSVREIIKDKLNGRLVRPDRPSELSRMIRFMLDFPNQARLLGENGQKTIEENFSWEQKIEQLTKIYSKLVTFE